MLSEEQNGCRKKSKRTQVTNYNASARNTSKEKEPCCGMDQLVEGIQYGSTFLGIRKLKNDGHSQTVVRFLKET